MSTLQMQKGHKMAIRSPKGLSPLGGEMLDHAAVTLAGAMTIPAHTRQTCRDLAALFWLDKPPRAYSSAKRDALAASLFAAAQRFRNQAAKLR